MCLKTRRRVANARTNRRKIPGIYLFARYPRLSNTCKTLEQRISVRRLAVVMANGWQLSLFALKMNGGRTLSTLAIGDGVTCSSPHCIPALLIRDAASELFQSKDWQDPSIMVVRQQMTDWYCGGGSFSAAIRPGHSLTLQPSARATL